MAQQSITLPSFAINIPDFFSKKWNGKIYGKSIYLDGDKIAVDAETLQTLRVLEEFSFAPFGEYAPEIRVYCDTKSNLEAWHKRLCSIKIDVVAECDYNGKRIGLYTLHSNEYDFPRDLAIGHDRVYKSIGADEFEAFKAQIEAFNQQPKADA